MTRAHHLRKRLSLLFFVMVLVLLAGCGFLYYSIKEQASYSTKISITSRQKALAEEISKNLLLSLDRQKAGTDLTNDILELKISLDKLENAQKALLNGSELYGTEKANSPEVQLLLQQSSPVFMQSRDNIMSFLGEPAKLNSENVRGLINSLNSYVDHMHNVTGAYLRENERATKFSLWAFWGICGAAIGLMIFTLFAVIRPLKRTFDDSDKLVQEMEEKILKSDNTKSEFLSNMSHEIRTPLNGVIGMSEVLSRTQLDQEQRGFVRNIHASAQNLLDVVNDVLDYSKLKSGKLELHKERFILSDCIEQVIDLMKPLAHGKKLELMSDIDPQVPLEVVQDERRLRQVLVNLVSNAIKFTENGEVLIKVENVNKEGEFVQMKFSVKDTGIGIDPSVGDNLFQSFYQVDSSISKKYGGSGLGLAICKSLVGEMGGRIWVESKQGAGSTFYFTLVAETAGATQQIKIDSLHGLRALIVDDNKTNLRILVKQLTSWGVQATPFNSPELVTEIMSNLHKFDFVLMDMQMPEMDGRALAKRIRQDYSARKLPIIVLSSVGEHLMNDNEGFYNAYLTKPVKQTKLLDTIVDVLGISPAELAKEKVSTGKYDLQSAKSKLKILIAQDNELSRAVTARTLDLLGHTYTSVMTGKELLERSRKEEFDLILMDLERDEMTGIETTRKLKKLLGRNDMPVIIGITEDEKRDKDSCIQAGMDDLMEKPMKAEVLQEKIHYWLETE